MVRTSSHHCLPLPPHGPGGADRAHVIEAPGRVPEGVPSVFLAGSIEMGAAERWQDRVSARLSDHFCAGDITILNPRRADWDASWDQSIADPGFREQVSWELDGIERSPVIGMYFAANARSPITLLELGLVAAQRKQVVVYAGDDWYRRGNLEVLCHRYGIPLFDDSDAWERALIDACESVCGSGSG